jgi:dihydrofolate reductase
MHGELGGETNASSTVVRERRANIGATIMGRNMFGPIRGEWPDESWRGWWGEDPPYHILCSCSPITRASHSRCKVARPSIS